jgi:polyisoprenoid-binding protein YceI
MRTKRWSVYATAALAALLLVAGSGVEAEGEAPGKLTFKANNEMYNAEGTFHKWQFTRVDIPDGDIARGSVEFEVDLASVSEKSSKLADHLRTADFFDVSKYTTATVKIDRVKSTGDKSYAGIASVRLHGHQAEVPVEFTVVGESPLKIDGSATLKRTDFGIGKPYDPGNERSIVDDVEIGLQGVTVAN